MTAYAGGITEIEDLSEISGLVLTKFADTSRISTTVLADDPDLITPSLDANSTWVIDGWLWWTSTVDTPDIKFAFAGPAGGDVQWMLHALITTQTSNSGAQDIGIQTGFGNTHARASINGSTSGHIRGYLTLGGTAGSVRLQWAQNTSIATAVVLKEGSYLRFRRVL